jgi:hypothetical protein
MFMIARMSVGSNESSVHCSFVTSESSRSVPKCDRTAPAHGQRSADPSSGRLGNSVTFLLFVVFGRGRGGLYYTARGLPELNTETCVLPSDPGSQ